MTIVSVCSAIAQLVGLLHHDTSDYAASCAAVSASTCFLVGGRGSAQSALLLFARRDLSTYEQPNCISIALLLVNTAFDSCHIPTHSRTIVKLSSSRTKATWLVVALVPVPGLRCSSSDTPTLPGWCAFLYGSLRRPFLPLDD
jgi:hypothetical protein